MPPQRRRVSPYNQVGLGECGHLVTTWPVIGDLTGRNARVFCDECARITYGIEANDKFILVRLTSKGYKPTLEGPSKPAPKKRTPSKPRKKIEKPQSAFLQMLSEEGLF